MIFNLEGSLKSNTLNFCRPHWHIVIVGVVSNEQLWCFRFERWVNHRLRPHAKEDTDLQVFGADVFVQGTQHGMREGVL